MPTCCSGDDAPPPPHIYPPRPPVARLQACCTASLYAAAATGHGRVASPASCSEPPPLSTRAQAEKSGVTLLDEAGVANERRFRPPRCARLVPPPPWCAPAVGRSPLCTASHQCKERAVHAVHSSAPIFRLVPLFTVLLFSSGRCDPDLTPPPPAAPSRVGEGAAVVRALLCVGVSFLPVTGRAVARASRGACRVPPSNSPRGGVAQRQ